MHISQNTLTVFNHAVHINSDTADFQSNVKRSTKNKIRVEEAFLVEVSSRYFEWYFLAEPLK
jgi:hypothetical protein